MFKGIFVFTVMHLALIGTVLGDGTITIIKVNGPYGIISKGANQGLQEGQMLSVKRATRQGPVDICEVKVIRTTANRAAIEQIGRSRGVLIRKGDQLFERNRPSSDVRRQLSRRESRASSRLASDPVPRPSTQSNFEPITEPAHDPVATDDLEVYRPPKGQVYGAVGRFRKPWIGLNVGGMFPGGELSSAYSASPKFGLSYLVATGRDFHLGVEINHAVLSGSAFGGSSAFSNDASSMLEALVIFQKFFGDYFFVEGGAGIFRPKLRLTSVDDVETTYSSTHLGFVGGAGFFVPTSPFAGFTMKGRMHNYYDKTSKHYFGLSGGFRFKIR